MGLESSTSGGLSSDAQTVATTEELKRGGSLDSSREEDAHEKSEECAKGDAEADQPGITRNGSLDNARSG